MYDENIIEGLSEVFVSRTNKITQDLLLKMANRIKLIGQLTATDLEQIMKLNNINQDIQLFLQELAKATGLNIADINAIYNNSAQMIYKEAEPYYLANNVAFVPYKDNTRIQNIYNAISKQTNDTFINLSNTTNLGFTSIVDGKVKYTDLATKYQELVDTAIINVTSGLEPYNSQIRKVVKDITNSGVRYMPKGVYKSDYSRRLDSMARQNVLDGIKELNMLIEEEVGEQFGSDGVELTAHVPCAEDHLPYQGRQFTNEEFETLQEETLERKISTWNCRHFIRRIVMGVNEQKLSKEKLEEMANESNSVFEFEGKEYTKYEGTQLQRQIETEIRKQKDIQMFNKEFGDIEVAQKAQMKIDLLTTKYNDLSKISGLPTKNSRMSVSGYRRIAL